MRGVDILSRVSRMSRAVELMLSVGGADSGRVPPPNTFTNNTQLKAVTSVVDPWIRIQIGSGFNGVPGSRIQEGKNGPQVNKFQLLKCWMFSFDGLKASPCSLDVLYGGPGISKWQFLTKKRKKISAVFFYTYIFGHQKPGSVSGFT
jgi:hypothetical protein